MPSTRLVLGVDEVGERPQLLELVLVLVHLDQGSVIISDTIEGVLQYTRAETGHATKSWVRFPYEGASTHQAKTCRRRCSLCFHVLMLGSSTAL